MGDLAFELEHVLRRCAGPAVNCAVTLLNRGERVDDLVAVMAHTDDGLRLAVGRAANLFASTPELMIESIRNRDCVPLGYLQWVALLAPKVAWGAFSVTPRIAAEA
jgi:hypothetical protein